uniref:Uncharacterized protein n=1 Tax=Oryza nivara TaxID=4536 RepID=A0A0E0GYD6_ORYNI
MDRGSASDRPRICRPRSAAQLVGRRIDSNSPKMGQPKFRPAWEDLGRNRGNHQKGQVATFWPSPAQLAAHSQARPARTPAGQAASQPAKPCAHASQPSRAPMRAMPAFALRRCS